MSLHWMQEFPYSSVFLVVLCHGWTLMGGLNLLSPVGLCPYGIPKKENTFFPGSISVTPPLILPDFILTVLYFRSLWVFSDLVVFDSVSVYTLTILGVLLLVVFRKAFASVFFWSVTITGGELGSSSSVMSVKFDWVWLAEFKVTDISLMVELSSSVELLFFWFRFE